MEPSAAPFARDLGHRLRRPELVRLYPLFFTTRRKRLDTVLAALRQLEGGLPLQSKVLTTRYTDGLPGVPPAARTSLLARLEAFVPPFPSAS